MLKRLLAPPRFFRIRLGSFRPRAVCTWDESPQLLRTNARCCRGLFSCGAAVSCLVLGIVVLLGPFAKGAGSEGDAADAILVQLKKLHRNAEASREASDYERLEQLRLQRISLIKKIPEDLVDGHELTVWREGVAALRQVNGVSVTAGVLVDAIEPQPGLVDQLKYHEAFEALNTAFENFPNDGSPLFGDLATRMFEVVQQAKFIHGEAVHDPNAKSFLATKEQLLGALKQTENRDPCSSVSTVMRHFLTPLDPNEAFLTIDVRKTSKARQADLLRMSHPLTVVNAALRTEAMESPVLPVHARAELLKADTLRFALRDLSLTVPLVKDLPFTRARADILPFGGVDQGESLKLGAPEYIVPGFVHDFWDESGRLVQLLYGRVFLTRVADAEGRERVALIYYDANATEPKWKKVFLNVLVYENSEKTEPSGRTQLSQVRQLLGSEVARFKLELNGDKFSLYDYPLQHTKAFLRQRVHLLMLDDVYGLQDATFEVANNDADFLLRRIKGASEDCPVRTTPAIKNYIQRQAAARDKTQHQLVKLFTGLKGENDGSVEVLVIGSNDDGSPSELGWFGDNANGLRSAGGSLLTVDMPEGGGPRNATLQLHEPGATVCFPLNWAAIPYQVLVNCKEAGKLLEALSGAGYRGAQGRELLADVWSGRRKLPKKADLHLLEKLKNDYVAEYGFPDQDKQGDAEKKVLENHKSILQPPASLLEEYGFRYVRSASGNFILHQQLVGRNDQAALEGGGQANGVRNESRKKQYAYAMLTQDGSRSIQSPQMYLWGDYADMKRNIVSEHLAKVCSLHPCLPAMKLLVDEAETPIVNPSERPPSWLGEEYVVSGRDVTAKSDTEYATTSYEQIRDSYVEPRKYVTPERIEAVLGESLPSSVMEVMNRIGFAYQQFWCEFPQRMWCTEHNNFLVATKTKEGIETIGCPSCENKEYGSEKTSELHKNVSDMQRDYMFSGTSPSSWAFYDFVKWHYSDKRFLLSSIATESAKSCALAGRYHSAIICYNDAIEMIRDGLPNFPSPKSISLNDLNVFERVPNAIEAQRFVGLLRRATNEQRNEMALQCELAGVLYAAGLRDSAGAVWAHIEGTGKAFLEPLLMVTREFFSSYGLSAGEQLERSIEEIDVLMRFAGTALDQGGLRANWTEGLVGQGQGGDKFIGLLRNLIDVASGKDADRFSQKEGIEREMRGMLDELSFADWVRLQVTRAKIGDLPLPQDTSVQPLVATPFRYEESQGFVPIGLQGLLSNSQPVYQALRQDKAWRPKDSESGAFAVLAGSYWLDRGERAKARAAFADASRAFKAAGNTADDKRSALVAEFNSFWCLALVEGVGVTVPGVRKVGVDFSAGLEGQLINWSRRWFAAGLPGDDATAQRVLLSELLAKIKKDTRGDRGAVELKWFFPDYESDVAGPIPDAFLARFFKIRPVKEIRADTEARAEAVRKLTRLQQESVAEGQDADAEGKKEKIDALEALIAELGERNIVAIGKVFEQASKAMTAQQAIQVNKEIVFIGF